MSLSDYSKQARQARLQMPRLRERDIFCFTRTAIEQCLDYLG
jgi:hypothetical protein